MQLNQDFVILNRDGKLIFSEIAGTIRPFAVHEPDLLLLSMFFKPQEPAAVAQQFINHAWVKKWLPHALSNQVIQRIQQFETAQLLSQSSVSKNAIEPVVCNDFKELSSLTLPTQLTVSRNLAIAFNASGFYSHSLKDEKPIALPLSWVLILMSFAVGKTPQQVVEAQDFLLPGKVNQVIKLLFQHGWLIEYAATDTVPENSSPEVVVAEIKQHAKTWRDIDNDGRIPVYFVPHTADHFPLALGVIYSALQAHENGELLKKYVLIPITFLKPQEMLDGPYKKFGVGIWLFSNYMWSLELNLQISAAVKANDDNNLTIHGGPSTPDYKQAGEDFLAAHQSVDVMVHGEGEVAITEVFAQLHQSNVGKVTYDHEALALVKGITFRDLRNGAFIRTAGRTRMDLPDSIPSPYLNGIFDAYQGQVEAAIIESNRGCPFGCTFCDWGSATNQKVKKFDLDRVKDEIKWIGEQGVRVLWIADANYGMYDRDIELSQYIVDTKEKYGFPQEVVVNYTKNSTWRLVEIIKIFTAGGIMSQGIISIQTTDEDTLKVINRQNIKTEKYDELTKVFYDLKLPLSTDLMIGLPGITIEAFKNDLQRYMDMDVSVKAYPTQLLPNSPMADPDYMAKHEIKTDENSFIIASTSFTESDLQWMKGLYRIYMMADGFSVMRYVLRYLQWEHNIRAVDFLHDLLKATRQNPKNYQQLSYAVRFFNQDKSIPGGWHQFYQQLEQYILATYSIEADSGLTTALKVNQLCMPDDTTTYPLKVSLPHDFSAYFLAKSSQVAHKDKPLTAYPPAKFHVSDPNSMVSIDLDYMQYDSHQYFWELHSEISRPKSVSEFAET